MIEYSYMSWIWDHLIFGPLINVLIGLYNTVGLENLGLAVVWLTVIMRIVLLPLSLKDEARREKERKLREELQELRRMFANNPSVLREEQRKLMREHRFRRWPKIVVLAVQGLILVILYQVFIHGIHINQIVDVLYSFVRIPFNINTVFIGIDIAQRSYVLTSLCTLLLMGNIWFGHTLDNRSWTKKDLAFLFGFPAVTFIILIMLPGVKALFILSSMVFSDILMLITLFRESIHEQERIMSDRSTKDAEDRQAGLPHPTSRFR